MNDNQQKPAPQPARPTNDADRDGAVIPFRSVKQNEKRPERPDQPEPPPSAA